MDLAGCADVGVEGGDGFGVACSGDGVVFQQGADDGAGVVVGQLGGEGFVGGRRVDEAVEAGFVRDFAEDDADVVPSEAGGEAAVVDGLEEGGRDEGFFCGGAEGV